MTPAARPAALRIRIDQLEKFRAVARLATTVALADRMGVHPDTVKRTLSGRTALSVEFIGALLGAFPELTFGDLFAVEYAAHDPRQPQAIPA
ncbi:hypothetical protein ACU61A_15925 [Pseudonocardia sichuanensis]